MSDIKPNYVFVLDTEYKPLTPCKPSMARKLLAAQKAAVYRMYPFTIILKKVVDANPAPLTLKIDPGSKVTGFALLMGTSLIWVAELTHRGAAIKASLDSRRTLRHKRRARNTRYRSTRYLNRTKPKGWVPPSLIHRVYTTMTWVNRLSKAAPISTIYQELVCFDMQKLSGIDYNQGELAGYEVREYLLNKWDRKCAYCNTSGIRLEVEHIYPRARGGTNRISNLCLACESCNTKKGKQGIRTFLAKTPHILRRILTQLKSPLKDANAVNSTKWKLFNSLESTGKEVAIGSGGLTKYNRVRLGLPKTHYYDAACVGVTPDLTVLANQPLSIRATGHGNRQMCGTDKYGFPFRHKLKYRFVHGFQTGDIVKAVITKGKYIGTHVGRVTIRTNGSFDVCRISMNYRCCTTIHKKDGYSYVL